MSESNNGAAGFQITLSMKVDQAKVSIESDAIQ
jgi:hypothetical protein